MALKIKHNKGADFEIPQTGSKQYPLNQELLICQGAYPTTSCPPFMPLKLKYIGLSAMTGEADNT